MNRCPTCHALPPPSPKTPLPDISFARQLVLQNSSASYTVLSQLISAYDTLISRYLALQSESQEMSTQAKIATSNLALAEANAQVLEDALKKYQKNTPDLAQQAHFPSLPEGGSPSLSTGKDPGKALNNDTPTHDGITPRDRNLSFWKRKRPNLQPTQPSPHVNSQPMIQTLSAPSLMSTQDVSSLPPLPKSPVSADFGTILQDRDKALSEITRLQTTLHTLTNQHATSTSDLQSTQKSLQELQQEYSDLEQRYSDLFDAHSEVKLAHDSLKAELENLSQELFEEANKMVSEERKLKFQLEEELRLVREELQELKLQRTPSDSERASVETAFKLQKRPSLTVDTRDDRDEQIDSLLSPQPLLTESNPVSPVTTTTPSGLETAKSWFSSLRKKSPLNSPSASSTDLKGHSQLPSLENVDMCKQDEGSEIPIEEQAVEGDLSAKHDAHIAIPDTHLAIPILAETVTEEDQLSKSQKRINRISMRISELSKDSLASSDTSEEGEEKAMALEEIDTPTLNSSFRQMAPIFNVDPDVDTLHCEADESNSIGDISSQTLKRSSRYSALSATTNRSSRPKHYDHLNEDASDHDVDSGIADNWNRPRGFFLANMNSGRRQASEESFSSMTAFAKRLERRKELETLSRSTSSDSSLKSLVDFADNAPTQLPFEPNGNEDSIVPSLTRSETARTIDTVTTTDVIWDEEPSQHSPLNPSSASGLMSLTTEDGAKGLGFSLEEGRGCESPTEEEAISSLLDTRYPSNLPRRRFTARNNTDPVLPSQLSRSSNVDQLDLSPPPKLNALRAFPLQKSYSEHAPNDSMRKGPKSLSMTGQRTPSSTGMNRAKSTSSSVSSSSSSTSIPTPQSASSASNTPRNFLERFDAERGKHATLESRQLFSRAAKFKQRQKEATTALKREGSSGVALDELMRNLATDLGFEEDFK